MYGPARFLEDDPAEIVGMLERAEFGHLVAVDGEGLAAAAMPFVVDTDGGRVASVRGHLARANSFWRLAADEPTDVLAIVPGVDGYVSPSWYPSKAEHGRVVPTWNYEVVHVHGRMRVHDDAAWVERLVRDLTARHETGRAVPWSVDDAPREFVEAQLRGIVGIEVAVERVEAKRKLSQNRPADDRAGVLAALEAEHPSLATAMRRSPPP